jgi:hypothetical protein
MPSAERKKKRRKGEGRFARHWRLAREILEEPKRILPLARAVLVETWRLRGGGFYGLGYLIAFAWLQVSLILGDVSESHSLTEFATGAAIEYVLRVSLLAFVNVFLAALWPLYVLQLLKGTGIILLGLGYLAFEYALRPLVEQHFPELRDPASQNLEQ